MSEPSDEQLMLEVKNGQSAALTELVNRYYRPLFSYLCRYTSNQTLAEDLIQETFLTLLKQTTYHYGKPFRPWIYTVATNLARNYFNSAAVRHTAGSFEIEVETESGELEQAPQLPTGWSATEWDPQELLLQQEESRQIAAAFEQLPESQRITLILRFYSELTLEEIATTLDIPLGTVKSRLSLGVRRLRVILQQMYSEAPNSPEPGGRRNK